MALESQPNGPNGIAVERRVLGPPPFLIVAGSPEQYWVGVRTFIPQSEGAAVRLLLVDRWKTEARSGEGSSIQEVRMASRRGKGRRKVGRKKRRMRSRIRHRK